MKTCSKCQVEKPLDEFNRKKSSKDGLDSHCRLCKSKSASMYYLKNRESCLENSKKTLERVKSYMREAKSGPCTDCGVKYPYYVMQFDHLDSKDKLKSVSRIGHGLESLKKEIAKCELVCANCHSVRTWKRAQEF